jgi:4-amino-4-deoxy-L-arabinose transferase-like glycosyltransferase
MPKIPFWTFILVAILHLSAFRVDVMDVDASQYAEMSREMMETSDWLQVHDRGNEYLDKPPFLFWVSAASMKVFGVNNFGYKLPSILFAFLAIYATYRLTKLLYNEATGRMAALILGTCQGMFLMTNDVRTDTILMAWVVTALWMIKEFDLRRKWYYVVGGAAAIACGMMTKGPIALMVPIFCFGTDWFLKGQWKKFFDPVHIVYLILIGIFLIPMSIGLYQQFDMHPEKTVNGVTNVSGLHFFYWSQSFGRITGESPWNNGAKLDFLFTNMLWAFLPWIFMFVAALIVNIIQLVKQKFRLMPQQEWVSTGGFLLAYLALGSSKYQLPHYIFVVFPLAAIMVAGLFKQFFEGEHIALYKVLKPTHYIVSILIFVAILLVLLLVFPFGPLGIALWLLMVAAWAFFFILNKRLKGKMFWTGVAAIVMANIFLTHHFYYKLLQYQLGSQVGRYISQKNIPANEVIAQGINDPLNAIHFYAQHVISGDSTAIAPGKYWLTTKKGISTLEEQKQSYSIIKQGVFFKVSELTPGFLNKNTRHKNVTDYYLVKLNN